MNFRCNLTSDKQRDITMTILFDPLATLLLMYLCISSYLVCEVCLMWNNSTMLANIQTSIHSHCSGPLWKVCCSVSQFPACTDLHDYLSLGWDIYTFHIKHHEASVGPFLCFTLVFLDWNSTIWHVSQFSPRFNITHKFAESAFCRLIQAADKDIE